MLFRVFFLDVFCIVFGNEFVLFGMVVIWLGVLVVGLLERYLFGICLLWFLKGLGYGGVVGDMISVYCFLFDVILGFFVVCWSWGNFFCYCIMVVRFVIEVELN